MAKPPSFAMWILLIFLYIKLSLALSLDLCSSTNLGTDETTYGYMSNGYCKNYCQEAGYQVAITQDYDCWCSNEVPSDTVDTSRCDTGCPGYSEQENCGGDGVYGYIIFGSASTVYSETSSSSSSSAYIPPTTSSFSTTSTTSTPSSTSTSVTSPSSTTSSSSSTSSSSRSSSHSSIETETASEESSETSSSKSSSPDPNSSSTSSLKVPATTIISYVTLDGSTSQDVSTIYITTANTQTTASSSTNTSSSTTSSSGSKSFFASTGKVAGTFTAVGVVVVALVATLIYCCCFGGSHHKDEYSDEENQFSSDDNSISNEKPIPADQFNSKSRSSSQTNLKRNTSSKSILSLFNPIAGGSAVAAGVNRSQSKKKLNPKNEVVSDVGGPLMSPISEFDNTLDHRAMFGEHNQSNLSLNDENDYSRRIWHVTNPE